MTFDEFEEWLKEYIKEPLPDVREGMYSTAIPLKKMLAYADQVLARNRQIDKDIVAGLFNKINTPIQQRITLVQPIEDQAFLMLKYSNLHDIQQSHLGE